MKNNCYGCVNENLSDVDLWIYFQRLLLDEQKNERNIFLLQHVKFNTFYRFGNTDEIYTQKLNSIVYDEVSVAIELLSVVFTISECD